MCMGRAHDDGKGLAGQIDVIGIAGLTLHQNRVFRAQHRLADAEFGEGPLIVGRMIGGSARNRLGLDGHAGLCGWRLVFRINFK